MAVLRAGVDVRVAPVVRVGAVVRAVVPVARVGVGVGVVVLVRVRTRDRLLQPDRVAVPTAASPSIWRR